MDIMSVPESKPVYFAKIVLSEEQQRQIIERAVTEGLGVICKSLNIHRMSFYEYVQAHPFFREKLEAARVAGVDDLADSLLHVYDGATTIADAAIGRGRSDNIAKVAAWRNPKKYSEKMQVQVQHSVDLSSLLCAAEDRIISHISSNAREAALGAASGGNMAVIDTVCESIELVESEGRKIENLL